MHQIEQVKQDARERVTIVFKKDLELSYFAGPGKGGQAKNKIKSGVQIRHKHSGAIGRASDSRSLEDNRRAAFLRMLDDPKMKFYIAGVIYELNHRETLEESVAKELVDTNLKIEVKDEKGNWKEVGSAYFEQHDGREVA